MIHIVSGRAFARPLHGLLLTGVAAAALAATPAFAQQAAADSVAASANGGDGQEIVVTARFREESLADVPIAITALDGDALAEKNINTLQDISAIVPTVDFRAGSSNKDRSVFVRGIGTITTSPGVEPSVATVIDGVVLARPGQSTLDLLDIERVEVLRGPQGTLFGKNASAGVINIVSTRPTETLRFNAQAAYYEGDEYRLKLGASGPLANDLLFSLTGLLGGYDGNVENLANGHTINGYKRRGIRGKLLARPTESLTLTLAADYVRTIEDVPTGLFVSTDRVAFPSGAVTPNPAFAAILAADGIVPSANNRKVRSSFDASVRDRNYGTSLTAELELGEHQLTSITAYREWKNRQHQDWDSVATVTPAIAQGEDLGLVDSDQVSQELRLTSPKGGFVDYVLGLYYFRTITNETYRRDVTRIVAGAPVADNGVADYRVRLNNYSVFGEANLNFTEDFRGIVGARLIHDDLAYRHARVATTATGVAGIRPSFASAGDTKETDYSLRLGLQYDLAERINSYATYSRGYKGPAYNVFFNMQNFDVNPLAPETSDSYEIGLKGSALDRLLTFNLAAYLIKFDGFQANFQDSYLNSLITRLINAGKVSSRGVEGDLALRPTNSLSLGFSFAYTKARIDNFLCPASAVAGTCADASGEPFVNGQPLPFAPKWKFHVDGTYTIPIGGALGLELNSDYSYKSKTQYSITQTPDTVQSGYGLWNASIGLVSDDGWQIRGIVKNIADKHYSPFIGYGAVAGVSRFVPRDNDRYFGVNASIDF
ncbi:TonB-dependent receptor [Sphingomonas oleivorans]|uniref:TonB-dependent receptor n=1 Tax=Sphingomonas oleivorans TaxID=1735121 RepID=A0A2T5FW43_9SPHN|nr:TonB-dependent receptor [Sphingomonas oleivorans]PTQ10006.1 TonB-dependent receptor [Sphingomonas oleivorans]